MYHGPLQVTVAQGEGQSLLVHFMCTERGAWPRPHGPGPAGQCWGLQRVSRLSLSVLSTSHQHPEFPQPETQDLGQGCSQHARTPPLGGYMAPCTGPPRAQITLARLTHAPSLPHIPTLAFQGYVTPPQMHYCATGETARRSRGVLWGGPCLEFPTTCPQEEQK